MIPNFPNEDVKWKQRVEQLLIQFDVDIKRLWRRTPQAFRHTDGDLLGSAFPIQEVPEPVTGSQTGIGQTGTANTAGSIPDSGSPCGPCGASRWSWSSAQSRWLLVLNQCGAGCNPVAPTGTGGYAGEIRETCCQESISGTPLSGTAPSGCDCGLSIYQWNSRTWILVSSSCSAGCVDGPPPGNPGSFTGEQRIVCCVDSSVTPADTGSSLSGSDSGGVSGTPFSGINTGSDGQSGAGSAGTPWTAGSPGARSGASAGISGTPLSGTPASGGEEIFTGTGIWTVPDGVTEATFECIGGGVSGENSVTFAGYGGGGGAYSKTNTVSLTPGEGFTINIGAGGTYGSTSGGTTQMIRDTGFVVECSANGGFNATGGTTGGVGDVKYAGGNGGAILFSSPEGGGGGGGGATSAGAGSNGSSPSGATGGAGGATGGGTGGNSSSNGTAGTANTGGGGGGAGDGGSATGGAGGNGWARIYWS